MLALINMLNLHIFKNHIADAVWRRRRKFKQGLRRFDEKISFYIAVKHCSEAVMPNISDAESLTNWMLSHRVSCLCSFTF